MRLIENARSWLTAGAAMMALAGAASAEPASAPKSGVQLTEADVTASNEKLADAYPALVQMWTDQLAGIGRRFVAPRLVRYRGGARTACGLMGSGNAGYCSNANTIYYDEVFVARQEKTAGARLGTDGDMAGIGIIAHEMGHAVAMQLGDSFRNSYDNESTADCLAGAFAKQAQRDGSLENGDLDEAFFGMAAAGDPAVELTGNPRVDNRIKARYIRVAHGTSEQRTANFKSGFDVGPSACLSEFTARTR
ncbi:MAG TPA: neutral zinc metallopeptidase [Gemmatimonadaceae bacterium]